jgi:hypothetical protein
MTEAINQFIKTLLYPYLKTLGFKKRGNLFYKKEGDFTFSISIHIDKEYTEFGAFFYIGIHIYSDQFETMMGRDLKPFPKDYDNLFSTNTRDLLGLETQEVTFCIKRDGENEELLLKIKEVIEKVMLVLNKIDTFDTFILHCLTHNYLVHYEDLLRYLAIKKDEKLTTFYFSKIKERLLGISDRAFASYQKRFEDFKLEY